MDHFIQEQNSKSTSSSLIEERKDSKNVMIKNQLHISSSENQAQKTDRKICLFNQLAEMLEAVAYTEDQAINLTEILIEGMITLENNQSQEDVMMVKQLFNQQNIELIRSEKLFYYGMLQKLPKVREVSQSSKSRIYHMIANIKKSKKIQNRWTNQRNILCIKNNDYKQLSESDLQQVIKYETIAETIRLMGNSIGTKYQQLKQKLQKMTKVLSNCLLKHIEEIKRFKYNLSYGEVLIVANISRQICNYYDNGVFFLLCYLVQSCKKLKDQKIDPGRIQKTLHLAIEYISSAHPLDKAHSKQITTLKMIIKEMEDCKTDKKTNISADQIALKGKKSDDKEEPIFQQYEDLLRELIDENCQQNCVYYNIAIKQQSKRQDQKGCRFFKQNKSSIKNKYSDVLLGKCVFSKVSDIISALSSIKNYLANNQRFSLKKNGCRLLTNYSSTADVTLQMIINNQITAQLQLTVQTSASAYNFIHKIHEIQRTQPIFSKLNIVQSYHTELKQPFQSLIMRALDLQTVKQVFKTDDINFLKKYFKLECKTHKNFGQIFEIVLKEKKLQTNDFSLAIEPSLQDFLMAVFTISLGRWYKPVGKIINRVLQNDKLPSTIKSVLLSYFLQAFQFSKESKNMKQLVFLSQQLNQKIFIEEYLKDSFEIQQAFRYSNENHRVYHRALQLMQIVFYKNAQSLRSYPQQTQFIENLVIQQHCMQKIRRLKEFYQFYFFTRKGIKNEIDYKIYEYQQWINDEVMLIGKMNAYQQLMMCQIQIIMAQLSIKSQSYQQAELIIKSIRKVFRKHQINRRVLDCQFLLAQCFVQSAKPKANLNQFMKYYDEKIVKKFEAFGLHPKGSLYTFSIFMTYSIVWYAANQEDRKIILEKFVKIAIQELSQRQRTQFIQTLRLWWDTFNVSGVQQPRLRENQKLTYAEFFNLGDGGCKYLIIAKWGNLKQLNLSENQIGAKGCEYLSQSKWDNLTILKLRQNRFGPEGCRYLGKSNWKKLKILNLIGNEIGDQGCFWLMQSNWKNLQKLYLQRNQIGDVGCQFLSIIDWENLTFLELHQNNIGPIGCYHISQSNWKNLEQLNLAMNQIGDEGCRSLNRADWKKIKKLILAECMIGDEGCKYLCESDWKNMTYFSFEGNKIGLKSSEYLSKTSWKNLLTLGLSNTQFGAEGCKQLSKADWKNLKVLFLSFSAIGDQGCKYLVQADWKNLTDLNLSKNNIEDAGCQYLIRSNWKKLDQLFLDTNSIGQLGCEYLMKSNWKNLSRLHMNKNEIGDKGCGYLAKADWKLQQVGLRSNKIIDKKLVQSQFQRQDKKIWVDF